jgi:hypothetical protein
MAYDAARGVTILFGGYTDAYNGETWEWNGTVWAQRQISGPSPRGAHAIVYDVVRAVTVLFGGGTISGNISDTWGLHAGCTTPSVTAQPSAQTVCPEGSASFAVTAAGSGPFTYAWQIQHIDGTWATLGNDPGPIACPGGGSGFAFATPIDSPTVSIGVRSCPGVQHWNIRCIITNACGTTTSDPAVLTICPADFDCSGAVNSQDYFDFLTAFFALDPAADFNHSGEVNTQDFFDFLAAFFAGCG